MTRLALSCSLAGALALAGARIALAADVAPMGAPVETRMQMPISPAPADPEPAMVVQGEPAPNFEYESESGWRHLRDLLAQGNVLLVFGAEDDDLRSLAAERDDLYALGVVPVVVIDRRSGACWSLGRRFGLRFPLVPDPQRVIASQFNTLERRTRRTHAAWFLLDRAGRVRQLDRQELPASGWASLAASGLHLPARDAVFPVERP